MLALPGAAAAQEWRFSGTLYAWLPAMSAKLGTPLGTVEVDQSISDVLSQLDFAIFGTIEARRGRCGLIGDVAFADLSQTGGGLLPGAPFEGVRVATRSTALSGYAANRVVETGTAALDVAAGLRWHGLSLQAGFAAAGALRLGVDGSDDWVDPVIGLRAVWNLGGGWRRTGSLDAGGFGIGSASVLSWQAVAEVEYAFSDRWSAIAGYRHLSVGPARRGAGPHAGDLRPVIGVRARF